MKLQNNTRNIRDIGATIPSKEGASQKENTGPALNTKITSLRSDYWPGLPSLE